MRDEDCWVNPGGGGIPGGGGGIPGGGGTNAALIVDVEGNEENTWMTKTVCFTYHFQTPILQVSTGGLFAIAALLRAAEYTYHHLDGFILRLYHVV